MALRYMILFIFNLVCKEPEDSMQTRCPRCFSTDVIIGYPYVECKNCGYNEALIDFPISYFVAEGFTCQLKHIYDDRE